MSEKDTYREKVESQLEEQREKLNELKVKAHKMSAEARGAAQGHIDELEKAMEVARRKLQELAGASEEAWEDIKEGAESVWLDLSKSAQKAWSRFR